MKEKVLIVEDEYVEANYLRSMLVRAGYPVCGIARSVEKALQLLNQEKPALVLLDIILSGKGTGIDLARCLKEQGIAFVYLSANSNEEILKQAKTTEPYGFLVKPFRENDLLITLEIATYRHEHSLESQYRREARLQQQLECIAADPTTDWEQQLLATGRALQPLLPFDLLTLILHPENADSRRHISFLRIGFDEYQPIAIDQLSTITGKTRHGIAQLAGPALIKLLTSTFQMESQLSPPFPLTGAEKLPLTFFSRRLNAYQPEHLAIFSRLQPVLAKTLEGVLLRNQHAISTRQAPSSPAIPGFEDIIGRSHLLLNVLDTVTQVAPMNTSILILGESGTGKERIAQCIHHLSPRKTQRLVKVNCAAIPPELFESELFGHEKGAFTGALDKRIGKFEQADKGTIFLDEIGEMPHALQAKLLHVLQDRQVERIGAKAPTPIDVRIIAATNRNLEKEVAEGRFRLDLYYRLNVIPIMMPALRERKQDILALAHYFIGITNNKTGRRITGLSEKATKQLMAYDWPGNIRELEHLIERCILTTTSSLIEELPIDPKRCTASAKPVKSIQENEREHILSVLRKCKGKIWGPGAAAELLDLPPTTLRSKMKKLGIEKGYQ